MKRLYINSLIILCLILLCSCNVSEMKLYSELPQNILITISTWNIGHFSNGKNEKSNISYNKYLEVSEDYNSFITNLDSDIFFCCEYSEIFSENREQKKYSKDIIFSKYDNFFIGPQYNYSCNALFSKIRISKIEVKRFTTFKDNIYKYGEIKYSDYYYIHSVLSIFNLTIDLFCVHCAFDYNDLSIEEKQYNELIEVSENLSNVIIIGDFNCTNGSNGFKRFTDSGYVLANNGNFKTCPSITKSDGCIDNIILKADNIFIHNVYFYETNLSDHNALSCELLVVNK